MNDQNQDGQKIMIRGFFGIWYEFNTYHNLAATDTIYIIIILSNNYTLIAIWACWFLRKRLR